MEENVLAIQGNDVYYGPKYIGSVCRKPQGHWTAYLATNNGDEIVGQYDTDKAAAEAVGEAAAVGVVTNG
ncbi:hypothetical protein D0962_34870 [Leptolyngbyaceae cyanobacterium CCMR0082]|uniref:AP2/ERF domain-containing protein n=1 Tax=Adonisia turfae CCMR0082 TaxID=2304604 RepID=A0A6M0SH29_9CYAN|nr:hypothetical protein [Adonisia turfae]NEZ67878.1 hypothetical protein [Adonisia turfae CCMR0082]